MADRPRPDRASEFDRLHHAPDPFGLRGSWYEERKRAIVLATLPHRRYANAWEIGCSNGELTAALADRCDRLLATDISQKAVDLARDRNREHPHVSVERGAQPKDWPTGAFDLIVFSEVGYFIDADALEATLSAVPTSLNPDGLFVACHWLMPFESASLPGEEVHALIHRRLALPLAYRYRDADFLLEAWSADPTTPAEREGLK